MRRRLVVFGTLAVLSQLNSGCFHLARCVVAKFRANHPCLTCAPPFRTPVGPAPVVGGPVVGPVVGYPVGPDCPGCASGGPVEGYPVGFGGPGVVHGPPAVGPAGGIPGISGPYPLQGPVIENPMPGGASPLPMPAKSIKN